jgi:hypothetical protein
MPYRLQISLRMIDKKLDVLKADVLKINSDKQLPIVADDKNKAITLKKEIYSAVCNQIVNEINEKIVPKVNNAVQWINYNMQDNDETIDNYRRAVERQSNRSETKLLTLATDERIISPFVRTMFSEND